MKTKIVNIGKISTFSPKDKKLLSKDNLEILISNGKINRIDKDVGEADLQIDAQSALITPGFVDCHTHPVFFGNRSKEFTMRILGLSYEEIASNGGGIISSIEGVRRATEDQLFEQSIEQINYFLSNGTTTIEAKSGYGLTLEDELKLLRVIKRINQNSALDLIPTFMGAHAVPPEFKNKSEKYVDLVCNEMIPIVAEEKLAKYCDVFCEKGYFSIKQTRRILEKGLEYNLTPRLHADEFIDSGAAQLASDLGAVSADHLMAVSDSGIKEMAKKGVIGTLLPGTTLFLGKTTYADGRKMIDLGLEVAIATDYNPGSCTIQSMPLIISLSTLYCGLTVEEAFLGATFYSSKAINLENKVGVISEGYQADLLFWDLGSINEIPYWMGSDRILNIMKNGNLVAE